MRNKKYKQTLLDKNAYNALVDAKAMIQTKSNKKVTFSGNNLVLDWKD